MGMAVAAEADGVRLVVAAAGRLADATRARAAMMALYAGRQVPVRGGARGSIAEPATSPLAAPPPPSPTAAS